MVSHVSVLLDILETSVRQMLMSVLPILALMKELVLYETI